MCRKLIYLTSFILLVSLTTSLLAETTWTGAVSNDWYNAANWSGVVPISSERTFVQSLSPLTWPVIDGGTANTERLTVAHAGNMVGELTVTGGAVLNVNGELRLARNSDLGQVGKLYISGDATTINVTERIECGRYGDGTIEMSSGYLHTNAELRLAFREEGSSKVYLRGGTIDLAGNPGITVFAGDGVPGFALIDISGEGTITMEGNQVSLIETYITEGIITAYDGEGPVLATYDGQTDITTVVALGGPEASGPNPADGVIHEDTWANLSWYTGNFAVSHDVYFGDNFEDVNDGTEKTFQGNQASTFIVVGFPGFPFPDGLVPGTTYYWRIDEVNDTEPNSPWKGPIWSFSIPPKTAYFPDPADGAVSVDSDVQLSWTAGFGSKLHTVYFGDNFDDVNNASGNLPQGATTYIPGPLKLAGTYYWRVDEFDAIDTYKGKVWSFTTEGAVGSPDPSNGAVDVEHTPTLTWSPGVFAASHEVYFGTDQDAVKNADASSPEYKGGGNLGAESYEPGKLEWNATYYWRIDEANSTNPDSPWTGSLWSFTTANFLVVDDFEDYDVGNNEIWWTWIDGLGYASHPTLPAHPGNGTGSMVGDETTGSYMEETIVHGGNQSMPVFYDNSILRYSEVEKTLTSRDWTQNGITTLSIWFRGLSDNAAETLYVVLNSSAVVSHDNPNAAQVTTWTEWTIDLQAFGVNLANVNTIGLGLGDRNNPIAGGSGTMYFDDIRLYLPPPEPEES